MNQKPVRCTKIFNVKCLTNYFLLESPIGSIEEVASNLLDIEIASENPSDELDDYTPIPRSAIKKEVDYVHSLSAIKSRDHIKKFLSTEDKLRNVNAENSLTIKKLKKKAWKNFKNDLRTKIVLMQESSLVEYFHDHLNNILE